MKATFKTAWGYQDNAMNLPVADVDEAVSFYERIMGFNVVSRGDSPNKSIVLARDDIKIGLVENGGDASQDGCAVEVDNVEATFAEFKANGFEKEISAFEVEKHDDTAWKVFYVIAPDGLCFWFGERQSV